MASAELCSQLPAELAGPLARTPALLAVIALPHLLYAFVWTRPHAWKRMFGSRSVDAFASAGYAGKLLQFAAVFIWMWAGQSAGLCPTRFPPLYLLLPALALGCWGQALNMGVYATLGTAGVYYGSRLGRNVPWVTGWPFTATPHPQYVGSAASVWASGMVAVGCGLAPPLATFGIAVYWSAMYALSAVIEHYL
uniref:phosphatidyl-N-methylethanolamine N-methyltransferase n=1 Tax=Chlamydomonas sphaeroides TaxID=28458 RepID=A0A2Z5X875_9CHLO|nr:phospholipid-N-methyltransferase [Chlamydomonas sphaeroides]